MVEMRHKTQGLLKLGVRVTKKRKHDVHASFTSNVLLLNPQAEGEESTDKGEAKGEAMEADS